MHCTDTLFQLEAKRARAHQIMAAADPLAPLAAAKAIMAVHDKHPSQMTADELAAELAPPQRERDYSEFTG